MNIKNFPEAKTNILSGLTVAARICAPGLHRYGHTVRQVKNKERLAQAVMTESAFNDALGAGEFSAADALLGQK